MPGATFPQACRRCRVARPWRRASYGRHPHEGSKPAELWVERSAVRYADVSGCGHEDGEVVLFGHVRRRASAKGVAEGERGFPRGLFAGLDLAPDRFDVPIDAPFVRPAGGDAVAAVIVAIGCDALAEGIAARRRDCGGPVGAQRRKWMRARSALSAKVSAKESAALRNGPPLGETAGRGLSNWNWIGERRDSRPESRLT